MTIKDKTRYTHNQAQGVLTSKRAATPTAPVFIVPSEVEMHIYRRASEGTLALIDTPKIEAA